MLKSENSKKEERVFTVSEYLKAVNTALERFKVKVAGEVTQVVVSSKGHVYFTIKDEQESVLECVIWKRNYQICGTELAEGLKVVLGGHADVYALSGSFKFKAETVELRGEGALKKAYERLKKALAQEGIFAPERKRPLPDFPQKIGVITSKFGAAINDLLSNLGKFGFKVTMIDSRVEGQEAVKDLLAAVETFRKKEIDVLVIMRGGGSLESLQAFNNEMLVRAIVDSPVPVIAAIGHEKDVPLVALAADVSCSTPTAAANLINKSWEAAPLKISQCERLIFEKFQESIFQTNQKLWQLFSRLSDKLTSVFERFRRREGNVSNYLFTIEQVILQKKKYLRDCGLGVINQFTSHFNNIIQRLYFAAKVVQANDPHKNLSLGYCIARKKGKIVKSVDDVKIGDEVDLQVKDGLANSKVSGLKKYAHHKQ